jgi:quercetin dioxygenase-like cupin family protein
MSRRLFLGLVTILVVNVGLPSVLAHAQQDAGISRSVLTKQDLSAPGREGVLVQVDFAPGSRESEHTHPGDLFVFQQEGTLTFHVEGKPNATVKMGEAIFVPAGKIHWAENTGTAPAKTLAMFIVEKGKPLRSPVK